MSLINVIDFYPSVPMVQVVHHLLSVLLFQEDPHCQRNLAYLEDNEVIILFVYSVFEKSKRQYSFEVLKHSRVFTKRKKVKSFVTALKFIMTDGRIKTF